MADSDTPALGDRVPEFDLDFHPGVKVRFTFAFPPFRASWQWKGRERSIARWGPFAARDRADELIDAAVERELVLRRMDRQIAADRRKLIRSIAEQFGEEKAAEIKAMLDAGRG